MPDQKVVEYIKGQLASGFDRNKIRNDLLSQGSLPSEIDLAFNSLDNPNLNASAQGIIPPAQNMATPYSPLGSTSTTTVVSTGSSVLKKVITTVVVLAVIGGISAAAYVSVKYFGGSKVTIGQAITKTMDAFQAGKINSGEFSVNVEVTAKDVGKNYASFAPDAASQQIVSQLQDVALSLTYSGVVNKNTDGKYETSGDISASVKNPSGGSLGMFGSQELGLQYKVFTDAAYLNVQKIPSITSLMIPQNINTTKYLNQWFSIPSDLTKSASESFMDGYISSGGPTASLAITDDQKKQIISVLDESGAFVITDRKSEKTEKGTAVTALYVKIDWDKLADAAIKMDKEISTTATDESIIRADIKEASSKFSNISIKFLIGNDGYFYGSTLSCDLVEDGNQIGSYKQNFSVDSYNKSLTIERPASSRNIIEVVTEINALMNSASSAAAPATKIGAVDTTSLKGVTLDKTHKGDTVANAVVITGVYTQASVLKVIEQQILRLIPTCASKCTYVVVGASVAQPGNKQILKVQISDGKILYFDATDYADKTKGTTTDGI